MAPYDSAYCLAMVKRVTGRPVTDTAIGDAAWYTWLSEAQDEVITELAPIVPSALYQKVATGDLPTLSTTDGNVWTFGMDANGFEIAPIGKAQIYPDLGSVPDAPWQEDVDYSAEGNQIRLPGNQTYSGPLYWRGIVIPGPITALVNPALIPEQANELTVLKAARNFAESGNLRNPLLADRLDARYERRFGVWCLTWKTQFRSGGALRARRGGGLGGPLGGFLVNSDGGFLVNSDGGYVLV